jgi:hypothetical protein
MPKPKYPIPNNNFPRFIDEYLRGHPDSQNDLARKINKLVPDKLAIPIDMSEMKSGNSNIFSWKNGTRPKEPVIRAALCEVLDITYIESLFLIPDKATNYTLSVLDYLAEFIEELSTEERYLNLDLSLNMYNIGQLVAQSSTSSKNYLNLSYLITKVIKTEQDKVEFIHMKKFGPFVDSSHEKPWSFWQYSQTNIYCSNESNNLYYWDSIVMLRQLSYAFSNLKGDILELTKTDEEFDNDANYNYYRFSLLNDYYDENLMCFCTAINLLINMMDKIDKNYLSRLYKLGISEDDTFYKSAPRVLLENNDLLGYKK